ncbi:MAG TPA: hypothetical protein VFW33_03605 [Gemmataceae bacterium]|nr:hypothetical protein [Gemmataceae bacterium]
MRSPISTGIQSLRASPAEAMEAVPVGSYVSNPRNEGPQCVAS